LPRNRYGKSRYKQTPVDEFALIRRYFDRKAGAPDVVTGIGDDGAIVVPAAGRHQVQVIDTLVEGVHFPPTSNASDIGYRVVAVNLSDIAAMGARPRWMTLALTLPQKDERWIEAFADGLFVAAAEHDVTLIGGDTTSGDAVVATVHITGDVDPDRALLRSGARVGDRIFVTGTCGDAAAGLQLLSRGESDDFLLRRFWRPTARVHAGMRLAGYATAAIDVSDGLLGDLKKLLEASGVGALIDIERVPLSTAMRSRFDTDEQRHLALTGGDDYELCFTAGDTPLPHDLAATAIGTVTATGELQCRFDGAVVDFDDSGYRHFQ
jgi:thiamine-monophosphate kinase